MGEPQIITSGEEVRRIAEARRLALGLRNDEVSRAAGYADSSFWAWQRHQRRVTLEAALCYLTALGLRVTVEEAGPPAPDTKL